MARKAKKPAPAPKKARKPAKAKPKAPKSKKPAPITPDKDPRTLGHPIPKEAASHAKEIRKAIDAIEPQPKAKATARASTRTQEIVNTILDRITAGESLRSICRDEAMPAASTFLLWVTKDELLAEQYARACAERAEAHAEELLEIADDGQNDWMEKFGKDGESLGWMVNGEAMQRSRLRVDTRKWLMSKMKPKKYGDKIEHSGELNLTMAQAIDSV